MKPIRLKTAVMLAAIMILSLIAISCANENSGLNSTNEDISATVGDAATEDEAMQDNNELSYGQYADSDARYINKRTLSYYCCTNESLIKPGTKVTAVVLEFPGLDGNSCLGGNMSNMSVYSNSFTAECAEKGIVVAYMFPGPWSWMNKGAVRATDLVVDAFMDKYGFESEDDFSLAVMGGSMGGQASLIYTIDSRHTVDVCVAHCPCFNVVDCFKSDPGFPRTFISAVDSYDMPLENALELISPEHRIAEMPDIPYLVLGDELDEVFPIKGMRRFAQAMESAGLKVTFMELPGQTHGGISQADRETLNRFIFDNCGK